MTQPDSSKPTHEPLDLGTLTIEQLSALAAQIERELDARAFEANLKREVETHMRRQSRPPKRAY